MSLNIEQGPASERITFSQINLLELFGIEPLKLTRLFKLINPFIDKDYQKLKLSSLGNRLDGLLISYGSFLIPASLEYLGKKDPVLRGRLISEALSSYPGCELGCLLFFLRPFPGITAKVIKRAEKTADQDISQVVAKAKDIGEFFGQFDNPRDQFINELTWLFSKFGRYSQNGDSKEEALETMAYYFNIRRDEYRENLPLLMGLARLFAPRLGIPESVKYAAPEIFAMVSDFLKKQGKQLPKLDCADSNDLFYEIKRGFGRNQIENVQQVLPQILEAIYDLAPQKGVFFEDGVRGFAQHILKFHSAGMRSNQIKEFISL